MHTHYAYSSGSSRARVSSHGREFLFVGSLRRRRGREEYRRARTKRMPRAPCTCHKHTQDDKTSLSIPWHCFLSQYMHKYDLIEGLRSKRPSPRLEESRLFVCHQNRVFSQQITLTITNNATLFVAPRFSWLQLTKNKL